MYHKQALILTLFAWFFMYEHEVGGTSAVVKALVGGFRTQAECEQVRSELQAFLGMFESAKISEKCIDRRGA